MYKQILWLGIILASLALLLLCTAAQASHARQSQMADPKVIKIACPWARYYMNQWEHPWGHPWYNDEFRSEPGRHDAPEPVLEEPLRIEQYSGSTKTIVELKTTTSDPVIEVWNGSLRSLVRPGN